MSCVSKVLEHVVLNRWQKFLERTETFPHKVIGFRQHLSTQDAMLQIKHQVIDGKTSGYKARRGLDIQSASDQVVHAVVPRQVSKLNLGERSYNYVSGFLMGRSAELVAWTSKSESKWAPRKGR